MDISDFGIVNWGKDAEADEMIDTLFGSGTKSSKQTKLTKKRKHSANVPEAVTQRHSEAESSEIKKQKKERKTKEVIPRPVEADGGIEQSKKRQHTEDKSPVKQQKILQHPEASEKSKKRKRERSVKKQVETSDSSVKSSVIDHNSVVTSVEADGGIKQSKKRQHTEDKSPEKQQKILQRPEATEKPKKKRKRERNIKKQVETSDSSVKTSVIDHNSVVTSSQKEKKMKKKSTPTPEVPDQSDDNNIPKKSRKNKYYHLALATRNEPENDSVNKEESSPVKDNVKKKNKKSKRNSTPIESNVEEANNKKRSDSSTRPDVNDSNNGKSQKALSLKNSKEGAKEEHKVFKPSSFNVSKLRHVLADQSLDCELGETEANVKSKPVVEKSPKLKGLKERMMEQLESARFRHLNEQLYTTTGSEAFTLFRHDKHAFNVYHEGFRHQVAKWPDNPLDRVVQYVKGNPESHVVADFGCGDAKLAESVPNKVHSFDLVAVNPRVTACDMSHIPLPAESVDIGVFCLSLMGTNLIDYLLEAHRVLKLGGVLIVAEVISRFEKLSVFVRNMEKLGFILIEKDKSNKMFVWFELKKAAGYDTDFLPKLVLQPCLYKKR